MPEMLKLVVPFLFLATVVSLLDWMAYRLFRAENEDSPRWLLRRRAWWAISTVNMLCLIAMTFMGVDWRISDPHLLRNFVVPLVVLFVPKLVMAAFQLVQDIRSLLSLTTRTTTSGLRPIPRRSFITKAGQAAGALTLAAFAHGVIWGKYAYRIERLDVPIPDLPPALRGLRIVQISDAHLGSFRDTPQPVLDALSSINTLQPDIVCFTGDLVNISAEEAEPWIAAFAGIHAPRGKFSILGNHDYADYGIDDERVKAASRARLAEIHDEMGFTLLTDGHVELAVDGAPLTIAGVHNWGRGFRETGDLHAALNGSRATTTTTVLLSHDPTHFEEHVMNGRAPVDLTLSGHTHGMQMGLEIPWAGIKFSPTAARYPRWAGLYREGDQFLHVNRGFGVLAFVGRVGMPPEITVLTLV